MNEATQTLPVTLSDAALSYISAQLVNHPGAAGLRLSVKQAGCAGYAYVTDIVNAGASGDMDFKMPAGWTLFIEKKNLKLFKGLHVDCIKQRLGMAQLVFINPNAKGQCGCGESFLT